MIGACRIGRQDRIQLFESLIQSSAARHGLDWKIVRAITQQESGGNEWALRFEPEFMRRYVPDIPQRYGPCSADTERVARATSWGLMQIMGQVARERGCNLHFLSGLCAPDQGLEFGCLHLAFLRDRFLRRHGLHGVIAAYNAGSPRKKSDGDWTNQSYVDGVLSRV